MDFTAIQHNSSELTPVDKLKTATKLKYFAKSDLINALRYFMLFQIWVYMILHWKRGVGKCVNNKKYPQTFICIFVFCLLFVVCSMNNVLFFIFYFFIFILFFIFIFFLGFELFSLGPLKIFVVDRR